MRDNRATDAQESESNMLIRFTVVSTWFPWVATLPAVLAGVCLSTMAYGHAPGLQLEHFTTQTKQAWIGTVSSAAELGTIALKAQLPNGRVLVVASQKWGSTGIRLSLRPGQVLAFIEGPMEASWNHHRIAVDASSKWDSSPDQGLFLLTAKEYRFLSQRTDLFFKLANVQELRDSWDGVKSTPHFRLEAQLPSFASPFSVSPLPDIVDPTKLNSRVRQVSGEDSIEVEGKVINIKERRSPTARSSFRKWMVNEYKAMGLGASEVCYQKGGDSGCNVEALIEGKSGKKILVTSHLDTVGVPGADDNGSATALLMVLAERMKQEPVPEHTIQFVSFDQEEIGLVGSAAYAKELAKTQKSQILGVINMDMIGYHKKNDGFFHAMDCDRSDSKFLLNALRSQLTGLSSPMVLKEKKACTNRSDHASFWDQNIPAIVVSENFFGGDSNPCYHKACDTIDKLNFPYYQSISQVVGQTVWLIANQP